MSFNFEEEITSLKNKEKNVRDNGVADGLQELPPTPSEDFNGSQLDIKFECQKVARSLIEDTQKQVLDYSDQLKTHASVIRDNAILPNDENIINETKLEVEAYLAQKETAYVTTYFNFLKAERALNNFRREKGISDEADAPPSKSAHYKMIVAYTIIEIITNAIIFNNGFGALDAAFLSIFISLVNIIPAVFVGNYFRYTNSDDSLMNKKAYFTFTVWLLFLIWINTAVAIYRSSVLEKVDIDNSVLSANHAKIFFDSSLSVFALHTPPINDIVSIFLWLVGIMFGLLACWKGYTSDDKIPEHGKKTSNRNDAMEEYSAIQNELNSYYEQIKRNQKGKFDSVLNQLESNLKSYKAASNLLMTKILSYQRQMKEILNQFIYLLNCYRDANKSVRHSKPPAYFSTEMNLTLGIENEFPDFSNYEEEKVESKISEIEAAYNQKVTEVNLRLKNFNQFCENLNKHYLEKIAQWDSVAKDKFERIF